ncbi:MAG: rod shape-determining protein MreC [Clostridiaceae bacterium]|jgi:rod shape-determining protein MreC|nr:rod shape-determining protein MreC [Clostridiaceae bacterium]
MKRRGPRIMLIVLLAAALLTALILTTLPGTTRTRVGDFFGSIFDPVVATFRKAFTSIGDFFTTYSDNRTLRAELETLERENAELRFEIEKNAHDAEVYTAFKEALNLRTLYDGVEVQGTAVLNGEIGPFFDLMRVNVGRAQGLQVSDQTSYPVVTSHYELVGRVHSSELTSSKVIPLINEAFFVSACVEGSTRAPFRVRGDVKYREQGLCVGDQIPKGTPIREGDRIITSGEGGLFPGGIVIGEVVSVESSPGGDDVRCLIQPVVDFSHLRYVFILKRVDIQSAPTEP